MERLQDDTIVPWTPPLSISLVPTQLLSTPGRDGEDESNIRPVRKRREVVRYQDKFQRPFQLDDYEATHAALFCVVAGTADESVTTYKEILCSPNCTVAASDGSRDELSAKPQDMAASAATDWQETYWMPLFVQGKT
ncbi:uncharacterized protein PHALS_08609 [Plasmopara halstedii]|uniref:Uncharacterized protein n=1 Tax=Plasmopara halstedii TaxID=4781 RepID=A0A0P1AD94_PLAHL|nr:uncharacterized protein PHALS_08609 [Plasmopara halstedii]CEG38543.1 hypothetical protein PHALS_08609 [Plasmopara halstedii]|eukprot:XP_024574912.1 hypothetical protein PHALS_08609 [Plasmopara halstedii]